MSSGEMIDHLIDIVNGEAQPESEDLEHRTTRRYEHDAAIGFVQMTPSGVKSIPTVVHCKNMSSTGMCVISRYMLHVGHEGAVLMRRSNGTKVILGVRVVHCNYIGEMKHQSGYEFIDLPVQFTMDDFRDEQGNMIRLDAPGLAA